MLIVRETRKGREKR